jgi:hypothetical protein
MPLKLNVGVSRKVGLPDYGSVGASCNLEMELDAGLLERDLEGFHARIRGAYVAAHQAVHDELARLQAPSKGCGRAGRCTSSGSQSRSRAQWSSQTKRQWPLASFPCRSIVRPECRHAESGRGDPGHRSTAEHRPGGAAPTAIQGSESRKPDHPAGKRADQSAQECGGETIVGPV